VIGSKQRGVVLPDLRGCNPILTVSHCLSERDNDGLNKRFAYMYDWFSLIPGIFADRFRHVGLSEPSGAVNWW